MKKITTYESGEIEDVVFVTPDGRGFRIFELGGEGEQVYEGVSVTDASPEEEAAIQKYLADPSAQAARLRGKHDDTLDDQEQIAFQTASDEAKQTSTAAPSDPDLPSFLPPWARG